jgi:alpha-glucosidase
LIALRRSEPALRDGSYVSLNEDDPNVLSFLRQNPGKDDSVLVVLNMSAEAKTVRFALDAYGVQGKSARPLISAPEIGKESTLLANFTIPAFGVFIGSVH